MGGRVVAAHHKLRPLTEHLDELQHRREPDQWKRYTDSEFHQELLHLELRFMARTNWKRYAAVFDLIFPAIQMIALNYRGEEPARQGQELPSRVRAGAQTSRRAKSVLLATTMSTGAWRTSSLTARFARLNY